MSRLFLSVLLIKIITAFLDAEQILSVDLSELKLFSTDSYQTQILDLQPLPKQVLRNKSFEDLYSFTHFNAVQSQVFHSCYYTDTPIILGAPTGSGKTIVAELCILRLFSLSPEQKVFLNITLKCTRYKLNLFPGGLYSTYESFGTREGFGLVSKIC